MGLIKDILYKFSSKNFLSLCKKQSIYPYYHLVRDSQMPHIENLYQFKNRKQFLHDIDFLLKNYKPLDPKELFAGKSENKFLLTFDDGLEEVYSVIYPILKAKNITAIFFINPEFVDNNDGLYKHYISVIITHLKSNGFQKATLDEISKLFPFSYGSIEDFKQKLIGIKFSERNKITAVLNLLNIDIKRYLREQKPYISKDQMAEMINDGFYFGGHTMTHPPLNQLSIEEQKSEIIGSVQWLKQNFGLSYSYFAFPYSDKAMSEKLIGELFEHDKNLVLFGNSGLKKDINPRIIQRFSVENPKKDIEKMIVTENLYKYFNMAIGKYNIKRK